MDDDGGIESAEGIRQDVEGDQEGGQRMKSSDLRATGAT